MGKAPCPHRLHQEQLICTSSGYPLLGLRAIHRERFLYEHGLARMQRKKRAGVVHRVRSRDVHDVDVGVSHQRLVARVPVGNVEPIGESVR